MARRDNADVETNEVEDVVAPEATEGEKPAKEAKAKKEPTRGDLPEGYVTPIGLAKELTTRGLHKNREGVVVEVRPQMVYSYIKNSPKDDPFPLETIKDSIGAERKVVKLNDGLAWWEKKNARVDERKANAAAKATKTAENKAKKAVEGESTVAEATATEAE